MILSTATPFYHSSSDHFIMGKQHVTKLTDIPSQTSRHRLEAHWHVRQWERLYLIFHCGSGDCFCYGNQLAWRGRSVGYLGGSYQSGHQTAELWYGLSAPSIGNVKYHRVKMDS